MVAEKLHYPKYSGNNLSYPFTVLLLEEHLLSKRNKNSQHGHFRNIIWVSGSEEQSVHVWAEDFCWTEDQLIPSHHCAFSTSLPCVYSSPSRECCTRDAHQPLSSPFSWFLSLLMWGAECRGQFHAWILSCSTDKVIWGIIFQLSLAWLSVGMAKASFDTPISG